MLHGEYDNVHFSTGLN